MTLRVLMKIQKKVGNRTKSKLNLLENVSKKIGKDWNKEHPKRTIK